MKSMAFIGCGVMGTALATAACRSIDPQDVVVTDLNKEKAAALAEELGCCQAETNIEAVRHSKYIVFCVKPQFLVPVLADLADIFQQCYSEGQEKIIVSIVAGVNKEVYWDHLGAPLPVIRILPNVACLIGKGFTLIMKDDSYSEEQLTVFKQILSASGSFDALSPGQFVAGTVLTSTAPAFISLFANSLIDAGVYNGLLREQAHRYALEGIYGTVQLLLESGKHPETLKDEVCSPGGPAIVGVKSLEDNGFRSSVITAVAEAYHRFDEIGQVK